VRLPDVVAIADEVDAPADANNEKRDETCEPSGSLVDVTSFLFMARKVPSHIAQVLAIHLSPIRYQ
jgi:hypothetical protein